MLLLQLLHMPVAPPAADPVHQLLLMRRLLLEPSLRGFHGFVRLPELPAPLPCYMTLLLEPLKKRVQHVTLVVGCKCTVTKKVVLYNKVRASGCVKC